MKKIVFTGGGSAGHVVPNLALMEELSAYDLSYIGTDGIEKRLVTEQKIPFYTISCPKLKREWTLSNLSIPFALHEAVKEAKKGLSTIQPDLVFSKGSYVSLPVVMAAKKMGIPVLVHESDLSMGLANKIGSHYAKAVLTAFPETAERCKKGKYVGNPIRRLTAKRSAARKKYGIYDDRPLLLVFGGGSGSKAINEALRACAPSLCRKYAILHLTGKGNVVGSNIPHYLQREYESDMASAYAAADFVLCRAGANTVFELLALKKPALLVPLAKSSRGDQLENAAYFEKKGLFHVLQESNLSALEEEIEKLMLDEKCREALLTSAYPKDNAPILREIKKALK
ncbi:MAG: UDP-N-acetylglucosamine--N-acetylmuramyl-(pentapeptide) pyrophosphoryl-undecaprenol N-acetylglucosamine transferase [Clostridia bacterium]|nr:UDP-N-acetylglucosamine--N-acetylmuramyl-(pentapeptide) pyrophosphoryl-undecaprenol N-acetylglucosamine transferase [Clostridia bacterium]